MPAPPPTPVTVEAAGGALLLSHPLAAVRGVLPRARYRTGDRLHTFVPGRLQPDGPGTWRADDGTVALTLSVADHPATGGAVLRASVVNLGEREVLVDELAPLVAGGPAGLALGSGPQSWSLYRHGWGSWSNARSYRLEERDADPWAPPIKTTAVDPATPRSGERGSFRSELVAALRSDDGPALVVGFLRGDRAFGVIDVAVGERADQLVELAAWNHLDGVPLAPGATLASEPVLVAAGPDGWGLLEAWADALGAAQHARVPARPPHGWCSWYFYYSGVDEQDVRENLAEVANVDRGIPFDYVMVDDGHQAAIGDWLHTNGKFPSGMAALAADIRATGRDAGIWLAPFIADPGSELLAAHPDWVVRDDRGKPRKALWNPVWNRLRSMWALDTTRPDVQAWLTELARTIRHDWGYRVLKLDFLYAAALPGHRQDRTATRAMALRAGLDAVRAGAGDDAVLVGCGLPFGPAVGVVDCMRIGADVAPLWSNAAYRWVTTDTAGASTRVAVRNVLTRAFLHDRLWVNDPDCVMVRTDRTRLTLPEVRSLAVACALTDGMIVSSDRLTTVPPDRLDLLARAHELTGGRARVVDLFDRGMPELVVSERADDVLVGAFNFDDAERDVDLDLARCGVADLAADGDDVEEVLSGSRLRVAAGRLPLGRLAPHDCRVVRLRRR